MRDVDGGRTARLIPASVLFLALAATVSCDECGGDPDTGGSPGFPTIGDLAQGCLDRASAVNRCSTLTEISCAPNPGDPTLSCSDAEWAARCAACLSARCVSGACPPRPPPRPPERPPVDGGEAVEDADAP